MRKRKIASRDFAGTPESVLGRVGLAFAPDARGRGIGVGNGLGGLAVGGGLDDLRLWPCLRFPSG